MKSKNLKKDFSALRKKQAKFLSSNSFIPAMLLSLFFFTCIVYKIINKLLLAIHHHMHLPIFCPTNSFFR